MHRNQCLDFLKFLCCFMIICIHTSFPPPLDKIIIPICRIAVPIFLMITGYYYSYIKENNRVEGQLIKITKIFIIGNILYLFYSILMNMWAGKTLTEFLSNIFNFKTILKFIILNESPFGRHLWYLGAILYVLLIIYWWEKRWDRKKLYPIIPLLLILDLIFGKYSLLIFGKALPYILVRNFLCVGLPYFLIGDILFKIRKNVKIKTLIFFIVLFVCSTLTERYVLEIMNMNAERDHYISTTFLAISVFLLALQCGNSNENKWYKNFCFIGSELSLSIYLLHPSIKGITQNIVSGIANGNMSIITTYDYIAPIVVLFISIIVSWIIYTMNNILKNYDINKIN